MMRAQEFKVLSMARGVTDLVPVVPAALDDMDEQVHELAGEAMRLPFEDTSIEAVRVLVRIEREGDPEPSKWEALVLDTNGFVMDDEDVRGWCAAQEADEDYLVTDSAPNELVIVTGTARPSGHEHNRRAPGTWTSSDRFLEVDLDGSEANEILQLWERALDVARAMNVAGIAAWVGPAGE